MDQNTVMDKNLGQVVSQVLEEIEEKIIKPIKPSTQPTTKPTTQPTVKPTTKPPTQPTVKPTVVKKALLIGINYTGTENQLNGCINDSTNLRNFLVQNKYFEANDITMMNDFSIGPLYPTKTNILQQFNNLVIFAAQNQNKTVEIFISYSGHGIGVKDNNGDELDGQDEALVPIDFNVSSFIVDDAIRSNLVNNLTDNVHLVFLCDSCHSGTIMDLKYLYEVTAAKPEIINPKLTDTKCNVVTISGCKDNQTSADAYVANTYQGAMTASFLNVYKDEMSYKTLITKMRTWLTANKDRFTQIPQLCSGKKINLDNPFLLSVYNN